jgi:hypothetical protein
LHYHQRPISRSEPGSNNPGRGSERQRNQISERDRLVNLICRLNRGRDGTTHVVFEPLDFLARLAALVPLPRAHLTRYHGAFAPHSRLRPLITPAGRGAGARERAALKGAASPSTWHSPGCSG